MKSIDIERIKTQISIAELIARSGLTVTGRGHTLTTQEHDSLKIFTNNNSWTWYSQGGKGGKALGGSVIDWYMHTNKCSQGDAIRALQSMIDGGAVASTSTPRPQAHASPIAEVWKSPDWQRDAKRQLEAAQGALWDVTDPIGQPGRDYLSARGIRLDAALGWGVGYGLAWNRTANKKMPALWIPYMNRQITTIMMRFLGVSKEDEKAGAANRFDQWGRWNAETKKNEYGNRYLCGLHLNYNETEPSSLHTLFFVEGELNAISLSQVTYGLYACDVVSFGAQGNINRPEVAKLAATVASRYKYVIVWADEPEIALKAIESMPNTVRTLAVKSNLPTGKFDANDLLTRGELDQIVFDLLRTVKM